MEAPRRLAASQSRPALSTAYVAPAGEGERRIAALWEDFLGFQGIGVHDNFFELGGHSLMATQITSRLREAFQAELTLARFFADPTVAGLAAALAPPPAVGSEDGGAAGAAEAERLTRLLDEIEELSEADLDALLASEGGEGWMASGEGA